MTKLFLNEIKAKIQADFEFIGNDNIDYIDNFRSIFEADEHSIVWCHPKREDKLKLIEETASRLIICDRSVQISNELAKSKAFICVDEPRLVYSRLLRSLVAVHYKPGIHASSVIHEKAQIADSVHIGPNCYIGECVIGEQSVIHGNSYIYDGVSIGQEVIIEAGVILGAEGFGLVQDENKEWERIPHIGGLELHDKVEIGAGTTIDRGTLENTVIGRGTKVSKSVHISHNVKIGENCIITGCATIAGSTCIGNNVWISPNTTILNKLSIGNDVFIAAGTTVSQNIQDGFQAIGRKILPKNED
jgi:UDP-3-O-[3-hydroxymyristoyl] glucosamine N-acyltransferase